MDTGRTRRPGPERLAAWVREARARSIELLFDLSDGLLRGECAPDVNPLLWEAGHVAWFQEKWVLRHAGDEEPEDPRHDERFDSSQVAHDTRWSIDLLDRDAVRAYLESTRDRVLRRIERGLGPQGEYFVLLAVFHEDMHAESFLYTRQSLGCPLPDPPTRAGADPGTGSLPGDVEVPGGTRRVGADRGAPFAFDNEKWAHPVRVPGFRIARAPVTQAQFAEFVEAGGYARRELWSEVGWRWRQRAGLERPLYWRAAPGGGFERRRGDRFVPLEPDHPAVHVSAHEAEAWCRFAGRRLPTEAEWEIAASWDPGGGRRIHPYGDSPPDSGRANLDGHRVGCVDVAAHAPGDSALGLRQMLGNVWEWTSTDFHPYPGFTVDPYEDYSRPWFGDHRVLRGGSFATTGRMLRNTWRNYYRPDRNDVFAGFRTCAV